MDEPTKPKSPQLGEWGLRWLIGSIGLLFLSFPLRCFDDATELVPDHGTVMDSMFALSGCVAAIGLVVIWRSTSTWTIVRRLWYTPLVAAVSFLAVFVIAEQLAEILENRLDFPPSKTRTYHDALLVITRAYRTEGKMAHQSIQTAPLWADIDISRSDYDFMRQQYNPFERGTDYDHLRSDGYYCAKVTLQQAGAAIRVLHAGSGALPKGSIITCPLSFDAYTHIRADSVLVPSVVDSPKI